MLLQNTIQNFYQKKKKKNTIQNQNKEYSEIFQGVKEVETGFSYLGVVMEGKL